MYPFFFKIVYYDVDKTESHLSTTALMIMINNRNCRLRRHHHPPPLRRT